MIVTSLGRLREMTLRSNRLFRSYCWRQERIRRCRFRRSASGWIDILLGTAGGSEDYCDMARTAFADMPGALPPRSAVVERVSTAESAEILLTLGGFAIQTTKVGKSSPQCSKEMKLDRNRYKTGFCTATPDPPKRNA